MERLTLWTGSSFLCVIVVMILLAVGADAQPQYGAVVPDDVAADIWGGGEDPPPICEFWDLELNGGCNSWSINWCPLANVFLCNLSTCDYQCTPRDTYIRTVEEVTPFFGMMLNDPVCPATVKLTCAIETPTKCGCTMPQKAVDCGTYTTDFDACDL
jgi:hypothetical protein